jgi:DNA-directed RNA polymerase specialized sigma subunit
MYQLDTKTFSEIGDFVNKLLNKLRVHGSLRQDAVGEAMVGLANAIVQYDPAKGSFLRFAKRCSANRVKNYLRGEYRRRSRFINMTDITPEDLPSIISDRCME